MKLTFRELELQLTWSEGTAAELVIENRSVFYSIVQDLSDQGEGFSGRSVLSIQNKPVEIGKYAELITQFIPFTLNRKTLLTKLQGKIEKMALREDHFMEINGLLSSWEALIDLMAQELPVDLQYPKLSFSGVLRSMGMEIVEEDTRPIEKLYDYMDLVRELDRDRLFIFVNLRSYFPDSEVEQFLQTAYAHGFRLLLLESVAHPPIASLKRYLVDEDLCEIY